MSGTTYTQAQLEAIAQASAQKYNVPVPVFLEQINQESGFNPNPQGGVPGGGIAQFIPTTAQNVPGYGPVNPLDPVSALDAAAEYDSYLYQQKGTWAGAIEAYGTTANGAAANNVALQTAIQAADAGGNGNVSGTTNPVPAPASATRAASGSSNSGGYISQILAGLGHLFSQAVLIALGIVCLIFALVWLMRGEATKQLQSAAKSGVLQDAVTAG